MITLQSIKERWASESVNLTPEEIDFLLGEIETLQTDREELLFLVRQSERDKK